MHWGSLLNGLCKRSAPSRVEPAAPTSDPFDSEFQRKLEMLAVLGRRTQKGAFHSGRRRKRRGSGVEFAEFRDYVPGDDFRFVDPHAAMRLDRLLLRQYEEEEDLSLYLLLDTSLSMDHGGGRKLRHGKRLAAAIAYLGLCSLARVTLVGLGENDDAACPTSRGRGQFPRILRHLRGLEAAGRTRLEPALRRFATQHRRRGVAVLLSDLGDPDGFERGLDVLRYERFELELLHITDATDLEPDLIGDVTLVDAETAAAHDLTITPALLARLRAAQRDQVARAERHCRNHGQFYQQSDAGTPFEATIERLLGRRGRS